MFVLIGTVTTKHELVHAVCDSNPSGGYMTMCKRIYVKTSLDVPDRTVTCVWCVVGKLWPRDLSMTNPCGEIEVDNGSK